MFFVSQILSEVLCDALFGQHEDAIFDRPDLSERRSRSKWLSQSCKRLAFIWSECGNVDETGDLGIISGNCNDGTSVRVADQQREDEDALTQAIADLATQ
jgi:hypothetical protein